MNYYRLPFKRSLLSNPNETLLSLIECIMSEGQKKQMRRDDRYHRQIDLFILLLTILMPVSTTTPYDWFEFSLPRDLPRRRELILTCTFFVEEFVLLVQQGKRVLVQHSQAKKGSTKRKGSGPWSREIFEAIPKWSTRSSHCFQGTADETNTSNDVTLSNRTCKPSSVRHRDNRIEPPWMAKPSSKAGILSETWRTRSQEHVESIYSILNDNRIFRFFFQEKD